MAMNKREKAALAAAELAARVNQALRWSMPAPWREEAVGKDLPPPSTFGDHTLGWSINLHRILSGYSGGLDSHAVYSSWSSTGGHGTGHEDPGKHGSQRACSQYSTRLRALRALRCELEQWAAERLEKIDQMIAREALTDCT
jgi:hypothetical protein